ncbi:hypothetical protein TPHA_0B03370 [Tetrapisispora phaffii CBS 4417]|uniref:DNA mismatch repair protein n=1 Tax=Tetrapisispora phaffii (strain ATCC 24235 / CBS 4417 / NBRC 1672 / NRRL Y-8282 / UCD 70-5) TaxID=1071381 RepID=G8BPS7_TETPH|nr:hypothetical protein TPHA_0B03370 [Tetrapisispora phaffii CBS 4417]CCE62008.1 hypothetical protein TPHA_0B03370 [Tetrapisispora phaffii CBS 4417]
MKTLANDLNIPQSEDTIIEPKASTPVKHENVINPVKEEEDSDGFEDDTFISSSRRNAKRVISYAEDSDSDDEPLIKKQSRKIRKVRSDDDDDDLEFTLDTSVVSEKEDEEEYIEPKKTFSDSNDDDDDDILSLVEKPKRAVAKTFKPLVKASPKPVFKSKTFAQAPKHANFNKQHQERYQWLIDIRDAEKRPMTDPEYDPKTLYIPTSAWNKFTAFEKQYWEIKSKMWDCVVFFKKGKFFELYEKDAILGNTLFDLKIAGGGRANMNLAGIPEMSFDHWASQFIEYGYKVAKVDQRESMLAKEMREGSKGIVKRELECVLTSGTLTESNMLHSDLATYCLAVREEPGNFYEADTQNIVSVDSTLKNKLFGVSFIDTATGEIQLIELEDDNECTKLETLMSQVRPKEIIMEKDNLSNLAHKIIKFNSAPQAIMNYLKAGEEFYDFYKTHDELLSEENNYFKDSSEWPAILQTYYKNKKQVGFSALGGLLYYLKWLKLDGNLISLGNMKEYDLVGSQKSLILDGVTLQNLEIFSNSFDGSDKGTLFKLFNLSITPMGKRMMKNWVMHPLLQKSDIEKRLDSVDLLLSDVELRDVFESHFIRLPDLERMLARIHSTTIKMKDFEKVIQGFETIVKMIDTLKDRANKGALGIYISQIPVDLRSSVDKWSNSFDRACAIEEDKIIPIKGVEPEFDESLNQIKVIEDELNKILLEYRKRFKCSSIQYKDSGKELFTIEVPMAATKQIPSSWVQMGSNKSTKRYYSDEVSVLARSMAEAREKHKIVENDLKNRICKKFDSLYKEVWKPTVTMISNIDCILALTRTSESLGYPSCRPKFVDEVDENTGNKLNGFMKFKSLRHPCFNLGSTTVKEFIPNDIELGNDVSRVTLLTGANAAGKSTVLRMSCIAVIMAQIGCYVPCGSAELSPVDRIMTRLGANDNIMQGKSTFFVELSETKKMLDLATNRSLLVLDELGRGGSSNDGFAIAECVLYHLATHIQSMSFFATHYAALGLNFKGHPDVRPMKMNILVDEQTRNITFLYQLVNGESGKSFGMHVASMCGISKTIVDEAQIAAENHEHTSEIIKKQNLALKGLNKERVDMPLGLQSDFIRLTKGDGLTNSKLGTGENVTIYDNNIKANVLKTLFSLIESI